MISQRILWSFVCLMAAFAGPISAPALQETQTAPPSPQQTMGQQAVHVLLKQVALDSTAVVQKTGTALPSNGAWSVGKEAPASCPQGNTCVQVFYRVAEDDVSCEWVVALNGDGSDGTILEQNEDAARYLMRKVSLSQAETLVVTKKRPVYPPIAAAAHVQGPVVLRALVSNSGVVEQVFIVSGPEMLRASAVNAVKGWVFKPLTTGQEPVRFETDVTFDFKTMGPGSGSVTSKP
jgi:TonB family protein